MPKRSIKNILLSAFVFQLSIACFQPKLATIAVISTAYSLFLLVDSEGDLPAIRSTMRSILLLALTCAAGAAMYFLAIKTLDALHLIPAGQHFDIRMRWSPIPASELPGLVGLAAHDVLRRLFYPEALIPGYVKAAIVLVSLLSVFVSVRFVAQFKGTRTYRIALVGGIGLLLLCTVLSTNVLCVITPWPGLGFGRFRTPFGFLIAAMLILGIRRSGVLYKNIALIAVVLAVHSYVTTNARISQEGQQKNVAEYAYVNRILTRVEALEGFDYGHRYGIVIFGDFPILLSPGHIPYDISCNLVSNSFVQFRQIEMVNWFVGKEIFRRASDDEVARAHEYAKNHQPYPAVDSVALLPGNLIVILLEPYRPGMVYTWYKE